MTDNAKATAGPIDPVAMVRKMLTDSHRRNALRERFRALAAPLHPKLSQMYADIVNYDTDGAECIMAALEVMTLDQITALNAEVQR